MSSQAVATAAPRTHRVSIALGVLGSAAFGLFIGSLLAGFVAVQFFGYKVVTVQSNSMEPALERGDVIISRPVNINDVEAGQVVLFMEGERTRILVAHRAVGFINLTINVHDSKTGEDTQEHQRLLQTKGDANPTQDAQPVSPQDVRGQLWFTIPGAGFVLDRVPLQVVLLGLAAATAILWAGYEVARLALRRRTAQEG